MRIRAPIERPEITAIVPVYPGNKKTIQHCLKNLARQTYPLKVLVLINNSPERFIRTVIKYSKRYFNRHSIHDVAVRDLGKVKGMPTDARVTKKSGIICDVINRAYHSIDSPFAVLIPADVLIPNMTIELMLQTFAERPDAGVVCLTCYVRNPMMNIPMVLGEGNVQVTPDIYYRLPIFEARAGNGAMMTPRDVYKAVQWRSHTLEPDKVLGADYLYCVDVRDKLNRKTYIRTDIEVHHMDPDGKTTYYSGRVPVIPKKLQKIIKEHEDKSHETAQ